MMNENKLNSNAHLLDDVPELTDDFFEHADVYPRINAALREWLITH